jgi:hypothetical protein
VEQLPNAQDSDILPYIAPADHYPHRRMPGVTKVV